MEGIPISFEISIYWGCGSLKLLKRTMYIVLAKVWTAKVRGRTHTSDVRSHVCMCVRNPFWKVCEMCVRADLFWACDVRSHFAHYLGQIARKCYFLSQKYSRTRISYPDLEHSFLFWIIVFCFRTSYSVFEHPKP